MQGKRRGKMMRTVLIGGLAFALAACGDGTNFQQMKQGAADLGGQAVKAASSAVDTRTACMLAGQSEVFCGCVQDGLGPEMTGEHLETLKNIVSESLNGEGLQSAVEKAGGLDAGTRDALVQCATKAAVQGALGEAGN